jgi:hypothetical protein
LTRMVFIDDTFAYGHFQIMLFLDVIYICFIY